MNALLDGGRVAAQRPLDAALPGGAGAHGGIANR